MTQHKSNQNMPQTSFSSKPREQYLDRVTLEETKAVKRVLRLELRTGLDQEGNPLQLVALIQSVQPNASGLPFEVRAQVRDILVMSPDAFVELAKLMYSDKVWRVLAEYVSQANYDSLFPPETNELDNPITPPLQ